MQCSTDKNRSLNKRSCSPDIIWLGLIKKTHGCDTQKVCPTTSIVIAKADLILETINSIPITALLSCWWHVLYSDPHFGLPVSTRLLILTYVLLADSVDFVSVLNYIWAWCLRRSQNQIMRSERDKYAEVHGRTYLSISGFHFKNSSQKSLCKTCSWEDQSWVKGE